MKRISSINRRAIAADGILYKVGGAAALIAALICRRNLDAEYFLLRMTGILREGPAAGPGSIQEWFGLLQSHKFLGLLLLNLSDLINYALVGLLFLALYAALKRVNRSLMRIAIFLGVIAVAIYFSTNQALAMNALSRQYFLATTGEERTILLAAGQAVLSIHNNATFAGAGLYPSFLFISVSGLMISVVMLQSDLFGKGAGIIGLVANMVGLSYYAVLVLAPAMAFIPLSLSAPFLLAWYLLVGLRLFRFPPDCRGG